MRKKEWTLVIGLVFVVWFIDRVTKIWASDFVTDLQFYGPIGFTLHYNPGTMWGMFSDLPPLLRVVSLSTSGAFLVFIYTFIQHLIPQKALTLRCGLSVLLGGVVGNVTDRIAWGQVIDFIVIRGLTTVFNVADIVQWIGYGLIVYYCLTTHQTSNVRKDIWIKPKFQYKYIFILITVGMGFSLISGIFSYTYLKVIVDEFQSITGATENKFIVPFLVTFSVISLTFTLILFIIGRIVSHRTVGPLYAFEKYIEDLLEGKERKLKLRMGDDFHHLEELAENIQHRLKSNFIQNKPEK